MGSGSRRGLILGSVAILLLLAALVWQLHGGGETTPEASKPTAPAAARTATPSPTIAPARPANVVATEGSAGSATDEVKAAPNPPPLDAPHSKPAPPQKGFTRDETIAKREADLKLLDDTKTRLEQDLATARTANDKTATHDLEVRLARLADTRKKRVTELEQIRAGGALPQ
ncbi:MAG TPA: hypothetical protein VL326_13045 [Kofleriaceae bacterium]|jgi:hypothetical protein|nr:hypothetical protein [Kofleriaceae bacterium]